MLFHRLKELPYWFSQFSVHIDVQNTSVLAQSWLYIACTLQRDKILTINVLCPWLLFKNNVYKVYWLFREAASVMRLVKEMLSAMITISLLFKKLYSELGWRMWDSEEQINEKLGKSLLKFTTFFLGVFLEAWNLKKIYFISWAKILIRLAKN